MNNLYLFCGGDSFSAHEKLMRWRASFIEKFGDLNLQLFHGTELTADGLQSAIETFPFLSEKRLVIVMDMLKSLKEEEGRKVAEMVKSIPEHCVLVFFEHGKPDGRTVMYKTLKKLGAVEEFKALEGSELAQWVSKRFDTPLSHDVVRELIDLAGADLWILNSEIAKLKLFAGERALTVEMVRELVSPNLTSTVFKLTDLIGEKRVGEALRVLRVLVDSGQELMGIMFMLVRHFRIMVQVRELVEQGMRAPEIAKRLKEHPFVIGKMVAQCRRFSGEELRAILGGLAEIDVAVKTGGIRITTGDLSELQRAIEVLLVRAAV